MPLKSIALKKQLADLIKETNLLDRLAPEARDPDSQKKLLADFAFILNHLKNDGSIINRIANVWTSLKNSQQGIIGTDIHIRKESKNESETGNTEEIELEEGEEILSTKQTSEYILFYQLSRDIVFKFIGLNQHDLEETVKTIILNREDFKIFELGEKNKYSQNAAFYQIDLGNSDKDNQVKNEIKQAWIDSHINKIKIIPGKNQNEQIDIDKKQIAYKEYLMTQSFNDLQATIGPEFIKAELIKKGLIDHQPAPSQDALFSQWKNKPENKSIVDSITLSAELEHISTFMQEKDIVFYNTSSLLAILNYGFNKYIDAFTTDSDFFFYERLIDNLTDKITGDAFTREELESYLQAMNNQYQRHTPQQQIKNGLLDTVIKDMQNKKLHPPLHRALTNCLLTYLNISNQDIQDEVKRKNSKFVLNSFLFKLGVTEKSDILLAIANLIKNRLTQRDIPINTETTEIKLIDDETAKEKAKNKIHFIPPGGGMNN